MRTEKEKKREAASRVFMATHSAKEIQKERNRILRKFSFGFTSRIEEDLSDRHLIIRALKDRENLGVDSILKQPQMVLRTQPP